MANKINMRWVLLAAVVLVIYSMQGTMPKESVAALDGQACNEDADCPCWGTYDTELFPNSGITPGNETAYGIGMASCEENKCDMTWCFDVEPVGEWARDNPWAWMKDNTMLTVGIVALILVVVFWPKN